MKRTRLGRTGLKVAPLGYGAFAAADDAKKTERILDTMIDHGVNLIDTAQVYPGSEQFLGKYLRNKADVIVVTKCGEHEILPDGSMRSKKIDLGTIERSLYALKRDCLDIVLLHSYDLDMLEAGEAVAVLEKAREQGKLRFFGYSGDNENALYAASMPGVSVIETSLNLCDQAAPSRLLPSARDYQIGIIAKRPVANAVWRYQGIPLESTPEHVREYVRRFRGLDLTLEQFDTTLSGWPELFLRFTLSIGGVHCAIVGTTSPANAHENIRIAREGPLPDETVRSISAAFAALEKKTGSPLRGLN